MDKLKVLNLYADKNIYYDKKGYATIWLNNKNKKVHVLEWEKYNGIKPVGYQIHHKDEDKSNWHIDNLELVTPSDHLKIHAGWIRENDIWIKKPCKTCKKTLPLDRFYKRKGHTPSNNCIECAKLNWKLNARIMGIKERRFIKPNINQEYECSKCSSWKQLELFKLNINGMPSGICKLCFNIYQNNRRKIRCVS